MIEYLMAGGGLMIPIVLCSIVAAGITLERLWSLRSQEVNPQSRLAAIHRRIDLGDVTDEWLDELLERSPLERLSAQVLQVRHGGKSVMQDLLFVEVKQIAHELERYLSTLGSMAAITPLLGLLGTVIGMIKVFGAIQAAGWGEASLREAEWTRKIEIEAAKAKLEAAKLHKESEIVRAEGVKEANEIIAAGLGGQPLEERENMLMLRRENHIELHRYRNRGEGEGGD